MLGALRLRHDPITGDFIKQTDVVLAVGTRLASPEILNGQTVVQIDVDPAEIGRNYDKTIGLVGDAKKTLEALYDAVSGVMPAQSGREQEIAAVKQARRTSEHSQQQPLAGFVGAIRNAVPEDGIIISGMTQVGYFSRAYFPVYQAGTYFTSSYFGNLGYAYPTALGAKVARPDKAVVAISGDGGFMYNVQEMATAVAAENQRRRHPLQRQRLRQRPARPARPLPGPRLRFGTAQPGFHDARQGVRLCAAPAPPPPRNSKRNSARRWPSRRRR